MVLLAIHQGLLVSPPVIFCLLIWKMGINPELLHRVVVVASAILTVVPQSGVMITFHNLSRLSMKRGLKYSFILVTVGHILALLVILLLAPIFY
ncbi:hypothetical protein NOL12_06885 [Streptococcus suis]|nr:hypothetical protein [Streptococcus parasuis]MDG4499564.1 hypothetical protein [Streptococcus suis]WDN57814.1 hypothetical protein LOD77_05910 [Streptococcus parasuis]WDN59632.1 hypothetical protein LOD78_05840 [Streptococcus parasuis]